ncbi:hypothetical protein Ahia01_001366300 [Argonauta hians]
MEEDSTNKLEPKDSKTPDLSPGESQQTVVDEQGGNGNDNDEDTIDSSLLNAKIMPIPDPDDPPEDPDYSIFRNFKFRKRLDINRLNYLMVALCASITPEEVCSAAKAYFKRHRKKRRFNHFLRSMARDNLKLPHVRRVRYTTRESIFYTAIVFLTLENFRLPMETETFKDIIKLIPRDVKDILRTTCTNPREEATLFLQLYKASLSPYVWPVPRWCHDTSLLEHIARLKLKLEKEPVLISWQKKAPRPPELRQKTILGTPSGSFYAWNRKRETDNKIPFVSPDITMYGNEKDLKKINVDTKYYVKYREFRLKYLKSLQRTFDDAAYNQWRKYYCPVVDKTSERQLYNLYMEYAKCTPFGVVRRSMPEFKKSIKYGLVLEEESESEYEGADEFIELYKQEGQKGTEKKKKKKRKHKIKPKDAPEEKGKKKSEKRKGERHRYGEKYRDRREDRRDRKKKVTIFADGEGPLSESQKKKRRHRGSRGENSDSSESGDTYVDSEDSEFESSVTAEYATKKGAKKKIKGWMIDEYGNKVLIEGSSDEEEEKTKYSICYYETHGNYDRHSSCGSVSPCCFSCSCMCYCSTCSYSSCNESSETGSCPSCTPCGSGLSSNSSGLSCTGTATDSCTVSGCRSSACSPASYQRAHSCGSCSSTSSKLSGNTSNSKCSRLTDCLGLNAESGVTGYSGTGYSGVSCCSQASGHSRFSSCSGNSDCSRFSRYSGNSEHSRFSGCSGNSEHSRFSGSGNSKHSRFSDCSRNSEHSRFSGCSVVSEHSGESCCSPVSKRSGVAGISGGARVTRRSRVPRYSGITGYSGVSRRSGTSVSSEITESIGSRDKAYYNGSKT